ncbi:MAG: universal stress protein [Chroococcidiopsidaceae cyanobacterium CP_BM_RX_35]|nr:universal stress protein [Chroococcidiopsidaceae cyanobacterium CP_BM_RX_35]
MNIKLMLTRLQSALGSHDLVEQMVLLPMASPTADVAKSTKSLNLVVGYNKTPGSQTALDLTLWIAHQTRLATREQVTVHIVYVAESEGRYPDFGSAVATSSLVHQSPLELEEATLRSNTSVLTESKHQVLATWPQMTLVAPCFNTISTQRSAKAMSDDALPQTQGFAGAASGTADKGEAATALPTGLESNSRLRNGLLCDSSPAPAGAPKAASQAAVPSAPGGDLRADDKACGFPAGNVLENGGVGRTDPNHLDSRAQAQTHTSEQANQILERAKHLAQEWGGAFMTHVRVGEVATELRKVVESEAATLLFLGCHSVNHPVVQQLGANLPCAVLGIPQGLNQAEDNGTI